MYPVVARSQVKLGAVVLEADFDKNSARLHFLLPDLLCDSLQPSLAGVAEHGALRESLVLGIVFQEVLRRYTGQQSVKVRFAGDLPIAGVRALDGNQSLRQALQWGSSEFGALSASGANDQSVDGEFFFQHAQDVPEQSAPLGNVSSISCVLQRSASQLNGFLQFEKRIWEPDVVKNFLSSWKQLLVVAVDNPNAPIGQLQIVSTSEQATFAAWNKTGRYYPHARVDELFDLRVMERPEDTAVTFLDHSLSYHSLSEKSKQLATRLQAVGVQPGTLVGVCIDRCLDTVVALLAIFRAGAAYLPLDPAFPPARLEFMQQDARPLVVLTQSRLLPQLTFVAPHVLCVDDEAPSVAGSATNAFVPTPPSTLDDLAYVLYTSGSTGKPKGVKITHRALTNLLTTVSDDIGLDRADIVLGTTTISFDISTFEIFAPLITGAHLVLAPRATAMNGESLSAALRQSGATLLQATPAGWQVLLESGWQGQRGLKMLTAGEPLTWILAQRLLERGARLWNLYGPTEATVYATGGEIHKDTKTITVGKPLGNYTAHVLDRDRQPLPIGAVGELYLGGIGVGAGYLNRPELSAEKFLPDPFSDAPAARMYRTGDLARWLPLGDIHLLGRADNQIKLRGYRIELEEVEAVLDRHPAIAKSVAAVVQLAEAEPCLVAWVVLRQAGAFDEADLRQHALTSMPAYMIPSAFMAIPAFILTPSGKVDRKALPAFELTNSSNADDLPASLTEAQSSLEQMVLGCWRNVLARPDLSLDHNFFDAGGHSLLVMRMFAELNNKSDRKLPICLLVEAPTARKFAAMVPHTNPDTVKYLVKMQAQGDLPPLYLVHHLLGDILIYRNVANLFAPDRPVYGIQSPDDLVDRPQPYSLQALASDYVSEILKRHSAGPIHLAGFSSGSVIAFEIARQLTHLGFEVGLLALIDGGVRAPAPPMPITLKIARQVTRKLCKIWFKLRDEVADGPRQFVAKRVRHLWLQSRIRSLEHSTAGGAVTMEQALLLAERSYEGQPYSGSALLIRFHDEAWSFDPDPLMGWSTFVQGGLEVADLPGGHITGMGEAGSPAMVDLLRRHIEKSEAGMPLEPVGGSLSS